MSFISGEEKIKRFDLPEAAQFSRAFCTECGAPVPYVSRDGKVHVVPAGSLTDFDERRVDANVYWDNRAAWYEAGLAAPRKTEADLKKK